VCVCITGLDWLVLVCRRLLQAMSTMVPSFAHISWIAQANVDGWLVLPVFTMMTCQSTYMYRFISSNTPYSLLCSLLACLLQLLTTVTSHHHRHAARRTCNHTSITAKTSQQQHSTHKTVTWIYMGLVAWNKCLIDWLIDWLLSSKHPHCSDHNQDNNTGIKAELTVLKYF